MTYGKRITIAWCCALLIHLMVFGATAFRSTELGSASVMDQEPIVLNLQPPEQQQRRLVDVHTPAEEAPAPTERIAEHNAETMDSEVREGAVEGPKVEEINEFEAIALPEPSPPVMTPPPSPPKPPEEETPQEPEAVNTLKIQKNIPQEKEERVEPTEEEPTPETPKQEPMLLAQALPPMPDINKVNKDRGPSGDLVKRKGMTNFSAIEDKIAPYLKRIQRQVEREWNAALMTRYTGTRKTEAVVQCEISPKGQIVSLKTIGIADDPLFDSICKQAIRKAGPFGDYTFTVPDIYRNQNLEIRWTFSFM